MNRILDKRRSVSLKCGGFALRSDLFITIPLICRRVTLRRAPEQQLLMVSGFHRLRIHRWSSRTTWRTPLAYANSYYKLRRAGLPPEAVQKESLLRSFRYRVTRIP